MEKYIHHLLKSVLIIGLLLSSTFVKAQLSLGLGLSGYKYLGDGSKRPLDIGLSPNLAIEFSEKTRLLLVPTFYVPVTYTYNEQLNINNVPTITKTDEQFKNLQTTVLFAADVIGNNKSGGLYVAVGPSVMFYNTSVTRENYAKYDYAGAFKDYILDARAGVEIPFGLFRIYAEAEIGPALFSDFKSNDVYYKPNKGTLLGGTAGVRIRL